MPWDPKRMYFLFYVISVFMELLQFLLLQDACKEVPVYFESVQNALSVMDLFTGLNLPAFFRNWCIF